MDFDKIIQQIIKPKKKIIADNFIIDRGILECDNYFVSLEAISMVRIDEKQKRSYARAVLLIVIGIVFSLIPIINVIGSLLLFVGIVDFIISLANNLGKIKYLRIRLNNGDVCSFESRDKDFLLKATNAIKNSINGSKKIEVKVDFSNGTINYMNDNSIGKTTVGNISAGGNIDLGDGIGNSTNTVKINYQGITDKEWGALERFFSQKASLYDAGSNNQRAYDSLNSMVKDHDENGLKKVMKNISQKFGEKTMTILLTGVGQAVADQVRPIIMKLFS